MTTYNPQSFRQVAVSAFPISHRHLAREAANVLEPFIDADYRSQSASALVDGQTIEIPQRLHFLTLDEAELSNHHTLWPTIQCLRTRSTDGFERQRALKHIMGSNEDWTIPFVVLLAGEYVIEITEDLVASLQAIDRNAYVNFVRENRDLMRLMRSKATSYWDCYYRSSHPARTTYPGLTFLHQLELWAS